MSVSLGSLGIISLRSPVKDLANIILNKADIHSVLCAVVFFLVVFILAYLTNPTENSFRAYLTEQSFRQHLSRLDDNLDDPSAHSNSALSTSGRHNDPFHFSNRASVSLRTPKHVFHSFGLFTIAAVVPLSTDITQRDRDASMISDSWFFGAFGKWWRGGPLEAWYHDVITRPKDEESWSSGILAFKPSDKQSELGLPFSNKANPPSRPLARGAPPKLRHRDRSTQRPTYSRSSSPPPLPKSASLPLHSTSRGAHAVALPQPALQANSINDTSTPPVNLASPSPSHPPTALFEQSPQIVQILRQISTTKASVSELQAQLADAQATAELSHTQLTSEIDICRERKRAEDTSRSELKTRTKTLEDSKRSAETHKRDAEKRLKAAQSARDNATRRMDFLDQEIDTLRQRLSDSLSTPSSEKGERETQFREVEDELESKKKEIRVAEDVIAALNVRARELEDKIAAEKERLKVAQEHAEQSKQERTAFPTAAAQTPPTPASKWAPVSFAKDPDFRVRKRSGDSQSSHSANISLGSIPNFKDSNDAASLFPSVASRAKGYSIFNGDLAALPIPPRPQQPVTTFAPFDDEPEVTSRLVHPQTPAVVSSGMISPTSSALIPTSLVSYFDRMDSSDSVSRSFQSESDAFIDRDWRNPNLSAPGHTPRLTIDSKSIGTVSDLNSSPVSLHSNATFGNELDFDPFEVRVLPHHRYRDLSRDHLDLMENTTAPEYVLHRTNSDPTVHQLTPSNNQVAESMSLNFAPTGVNGFKSVFGNGAPRRWFSTKEKSPKKGLDPNAKVFNFSRKSLPNPSESATNAFDALNPTGFVVPPPPTATTSSSLLRAFAPSPAEREVLQRVLGSSTNASLERLPSLSDVGSIPSSPQHAHQTLPETRGGLGMMSKGLPAWLHSLPRIRKPPTFSPWEDEEPAVVEHK